MAVQEHVDSMDDFVKLIGRPLGPSDWIEIPQSLIDDFGKLTQDLQAIHVDPETGRNGPFGSTIAHGFLTMSLLSRMAADAVPTPSGVSMLVNYGFDRVRFIAPVRVGKRIRGHFKLNRVEKKGPDRLLAVQEVSVEIEGEDKPALIAEWLSLIVR